MASKGSAEYNKVTTTIKENETDERGNAKKQMKRETDAGRKDGHRQMGGAGAEDFRARHLVTGWPGKARGGQKERETRRNEGNQAKKGVHPSAELREGQGAQCSARRQAGGRA